MNGRIEIAKPYFSIEEEHAVLETLRSGWVSQGPKVAEFEHKFAACVGARHAVATTSCTTALHLTLHALGIGPGDEVIVPSLSFIATANAVVHCGAIPVFVDVDPRTYNIDPDAVSSAITSRTKAIVPVHQLGLPAEIDEILSIGAHHGLHVIEDAACAIGSLYKGNPIGAHGTACFSFHPRKVLTTGEGGMITTNDAELAERLRRLRHHGMSVSDLERHGSRKLIIEEYSEVGYNYRMTDLQAAVGIAQLNKLPFILARRRQIADKYAAALNGMPNLGTQFIPPHVKANFQSYCIEIHSEGKMSRDSVLQALLDEEISCRRGVMAIHSEPCYKAFVFRSLPHTERISSQSILLPIHPLMSDDDTDRIIQILLKLFR